MVASAPSISFNPTLVSYGVINVGSSSAFKSYHVRNKSQSYATARNCSISFVNSNNSQEADDESWVLCSTSLESSRIKSLDTGPECAAPSVPQGYGSSINVRTKVIVPSGAATSGQVDFRHHFRYQYTG